MKKFKSIMFILLMFTFVLTGCGTAEESTDVPNEPDTTENNNAAKENESPEQEDGNSDQENEGTEETTEGNKETDANDNGQVRILEKNIEYTVNGETKEETAFLKTSDNQNYSMFVLPSYKLTAEEPNKDILMFSEDDSIFMRIELLTEPDWAFVEENTKAQLGAVHNDVQTLSAPEGEFFKNSSVYSASSNEAVVTTYLIKNEALPLKLTIFTKANADHIDPFLKMAQTIEKQ